ncbi:hypothetical protein [uncultured Pseudokineococcus sp.]|uniref:hypothetical protein n=1 Tax=uncultured Pseudokineococcus sp. TaxID=1642928 RepID=UPI00261F6E39|nr:hypothetical protein [uncultured Pseudokineococcus sp.]
MSAADAAARGARGAGRSWSRGAAAAVPGEGRWWRVRQEEVLPGARPTLFVLVAVVALQAVLRALVSPPGTYASAAVAAGALAVLVAVPGLLVALSSHRLVRSRPVVVAVVAVLLGVDVVVIAQTAHRGVYGEGLFAATGVGVAVLCLLAVRPLGVVVVAGGLHALVMLGGSLRHETAAPGLALARGTEMAAVGAVPVVAWATYLVLVARLVESGRASDAAAAREEGERRAAAAAAQEGAVRLAAARAEVGPLLERVVAGAPVPLEPADAAAAVASSRRLRARLLRGDARSWLDDALAGEVGGGAAPAVVVRAVDGEDDLGAGLRGPLVALVRRAGALGGEVSVVLLAGGAVVAVRGAPQLAGDGLAADLLDELGAAWIEEEELLVLEVGAPAVEGAP